MAKLQGNFTGGLQWFSLTPIRAMEVEQDATEYAVELWPGPGGTLLTRRFSVAGWQMGQDNVWVLARAFAVAATLTDTVLPIDLWRTGRGMPALLSESVDWLHVILSGNRRQQNVRVVFFIQDGPDPVIFRRLFMRTSVGEAVRFGRQLEQEIIAASPAWAAERQFQPDVTA